MATTTADAEQDQKHAEAIAENARRDEIAKGVDLEALVKTWRKRADAASVAGDMATYRRYRGLVLDMCVETSAARAAAELQDDAAFRLARAAELAGR